MSALEFLYWQCFYSVEPWGQEMDSLNAGIVASTIANIHSKKTFKAADFMPVFEKKPQPIEQVQAYFMAMAETSKQKGLKA
jgi:hypothetical protein